ncbi:MASE1 domain-containing protein [Phaeacidiphilus oryzae]|uniref:MASE1 domain-containing protein n=1 Tax=Phaeacidiphilus oryzae TaxID=348818 RepID=UPI000AD8E725
MVDSEVLRRLGKVVLGILAVAVAYYATAQAGLQEQVVVKGAKVTPLWPPTGVSLTCLLLFGLRVWLGIPLGALLTVASIGSLTPAAAVIVAGNALAPLCSYLLLRRVGFRNDLSRLSDGLALVFLGALAGMLISSTAGSTALLAEGMLPASGFWRIWAAWWTGDAMGVLTITPVLLTVRNIRLPGGHRVLRWAEPAALLLGTVAVAVLVTRSSLSLLFLVFPLLIWAALRFQLAGAAPCVLLVSVIAVLGATGHRGPFAHQGVLGTMVVLQALNGAAALTGLLLGAVVAEREATFRRIEQACVDLAEVVERLAPGQLGLPWIAPEDPPRSDP